MTNRISIIIVNWNTRDYLSQCLSSIQTHNTIPDSEIIVVDNHSTDGSLEMIETSFPKVILIRNTANLGFAKANNIGIANSTGEYLCLLNSDTVLTGDSLRHMIEFMYRHPDIGIAGPQILNADGTIQPSYMKFPTLWNTFCRSFYLDKLFPRIRLFSDGLMLHSAPSTESEVEVLSGACWMVRRTALEEVGTLDERYFMYSEDVDWCKRFHDSRWKVVYYPGATIVHYGGGSSASDPKTFFVEFLKAKLLYWRKHHIRTVSIYRGLLFLHVFFRVVLWCAALITSNTENKTFARSQFEKYLAATKWLFAIRSN